MYGGPKALQLLLHGLFAVNKTNAYTSAETVDKLKEVIVRGVKPKFRPHPLKMGHGGTLDKTATGVLVIGVDRGCKKLPLLLNGKKKYIVKGQLGIATDTFNETGAVTDECLYEHITEEMLIKTLPFFQGRIKQVPPAYSALKKNGRRYSDLVMEGQSVELKPRDVVCHSINCLEFSLPYFKLAVSCGGGFYIRSLVNDLGRALGSCAHVRELHRVKHGPFVIADALNESDWTAEKIVNAIAAARDKYQDELRMKKLKEQW